MLATRVFRALFAAALFCGWIQAQTSTGTLLGSVVDSTDAAVPGVSIELKNAATGAIVTASTGAEGLFRFNSLPPAKYSITVKPATGFKTYTQSNIDVTANEVRDLGKIALAVGALTENVTVVAQVTPTQTASSEN